jgi:integrase
VAPNSFPFDKDMIRKGPKRRKGDTWVPFAPEDVPALWQGAEARGDTQLADLIRLGAYSGARIEELCALETRRVSEASFEVVDAKTVAGWREVPIHPAIKALVKRLKRESKDGYLISGLTFNKYKDRSNAIGKRFGRMKAAMGYSPNFVFHSLRKTFVTLLENAGVPENLAADIVGHEKPRITYGTYSGGASLKNKAEAIVLVNYPASVTKQAKRA